ncbi:hypothetical protein ACL6C3_07490 [Capilliphycus salinus ALCB114379]|uniref:hypothetical protein n=1 Tax=Capilliphycus salinus TaxID=2768948 RepID=UPI0039A50BA4
MSASEIDQLLGKLTKQIKLANLIAWGCIEHRWAVTEEEREISEAMIYNAFEEFLLQEGMSVPEAERFCETHLELLIKRVKDALENPL